MPNLYTVLADVTLTGHVAFVALVVVGQVAILIGWIVGWTWTRNVIFRVIHGAAIGIVVFKSWLDIPCVLTVLENDFRMRSGLQPYEQTFIAYWLGRLLFYEAPSWMFTLAYSAFGVLVLATFLVYPPARRRSRSSARGTR